MCEALHAVWLVVADAFAFAWGALIAHWVFFACFFGAAGALGLANAIFGDGAPLYSPRRRDW